MNHGFCGDMQTVGSDSGMDGLNATRLESAGEAGGGDVTVWGKLSRMQSLNAETLMMQHVTKHKWSQTGSTVGGGHRWSTYGETRGLTCMLFFDSEKNPNNNGIVGNGIAV